MAQSVVILAGPNGSGKTTFYRTDRTGIKWPQHHIDPDAIAVQLRNEHPRISTDELNRRAFNTARALRIKYAEAGWSFSVETVFSHPSTLADMEQWQELGYDVNLIVAVTERVDINLERIKRRVLQGGHHVDPDKVVLRYDRFMSLLPLAMERASRVIIFDTTNDDPFLCFDAIDSMQSFSDLPRAVPHKIIRFSDPTSVVGRRILQSWEERLVERNSISKQFPMAAIQDAKLVDSVYMGAIMWVGKHLIVQRTEREGLIVHNRVLLKEVLMEGSECVIRNSYGIADVGKS